MYTTFYIFLFILIIIGCIFRRTKNEHFLSNTIELTDFTLSPLRFSSNNKISNEFLQAVSKYIPIIEDNSYPEFQIRPKSLAIYDYLFKSKDSLRMVTNIYEVYFTIITNKDSQIYTYTDILNNLNRLNIYYLDKETKRVLEILFPKKTNFKFISSLPKKLGIGDIYCYWETENSPTLKQIAKDNKFIIVQMPKTNSVYNSIQIDYPNLVPAKYDISLQNSINTERVIYSIKDTISIFTNKDVSSYRTYGLIKTLFNHIVDIRIGVSSERTKYVLEYFRPENLIEIPLVPYHPGIEKYFWELEVYTYKPEAICVNTISTIPCEPQKLFDNRYRMILYGSNE